MKIAIYSRKSKFTGKGDSIENQIEMCKKYIDRYVDDVEEIYIYEDEGYSGGNIDRPKFQELLKDARDKKFNMLVCYRLDRVSRDVADFSSLIEGLNKYNIDFVSIKEQFDTSTPMGRAMMYIASVFSQLERETISERVLDNMLELATTGRWLGGVAPTGYNTKKVEYMDAKLKERTYTTLEPDEKYIHMIDLIYNKYLKLDSIHKVRKYLTKNNYRTKAYKFKKSTYYNLNTISRILRDPVYVKANDDVIKYLESKKIHIEGKYRLDGNKAIIIYNKAGKDGIAKDIEEWVAAVSLHDGVIEPNKWLEVQYNLDKKGNNITRIGTSEVAMLGGIIRCANCGSPMFLTYGRPRKNGDKPHYYVCDLKKIDKTKCNNKNANGLDIDTTIVNLILEIAENKESLVEELKVLKEESNGTDRVDILKSLHEEKKAVLDEINNLVNELSKSEIASKYILPQIEEKDKKLKDLQVEIRNLKETKSVKDHQRDNFNFILDNIIQFSKIMDSLENKHKKRFVQTIVKKVIWDGDKEVARVELFGEDSNSYQYCPPPSCNSNSTDIILYRKVDSRLRFYDYPEATLGDRLRKQRFIKGHTAKSLGEAVGLCAGAIELYESNNGKPTAKNMKNLIDVLDLDLDYIGDEYYKFIFSDDCVDILTKWRKDNFRTWVEFDKEMPVSSAQYYRWEQGDYMSRGSYDKIKSIIL